MNKYQEAIKRVELDFEDSIEKDNVGMVGRIDIERLQELVDKATPMKPKITLNNAHCGKCGEAFGYVRASHINVSKWTAYCPVCGQKQDWSEEE